jgi:enterochelin esterase family protein
MALVIETVPSPVTLFSVILRREVNLCIYWSGSAGGLPEDLLLFNDGQDLAKMNFAAILQELSGAKAIRPLLVVGINAGTDRKGEYGVAGMPDYMGRGGKAAAYNEFILAELLPFIRSQTGITAFRQQAFAGFSLGGLSAMDIVWSNPAIFTRAGVFSGSFWWRTRALDQGYVEATDRIMHRRIRESAFHPGLKFFFETGALDETMDRNQNGIIDAIDDTLGLIDELVAKGYDPSTDIHYLELQEGRHDVETWAKAMPEFLRWGWGSAPSPLP